MLFIPVLLLLSTLSVALAYVDAEGGVVEADYDVKDALVEKNRPEDEYFSSLSTMKATADFEHSQ